jgi:hypothetical protein
LGEPWRNYASRLLARILPPMLRVIIEQGLLQLFEQVLKPLDRERIRRLVRESLDRDDPEILHELLREVSLVGPLQRVVTSWVEGGRESGSGEVSAPGAQASKAEQSPAPRAPDGSDGSDGSDNEVSP